MTTERRPPPDSKPQRSLPHDHDQDSHTRKRSRTMTVA
jgi:hypothetical protein